MLTPSQFLVFTTLRLIIRKKKWGKEEIDCNEFSLFSTMYFYRVDLDLRFFFELLFHTEMSATSSNLDESKIVPSAKGLDESLNDGFSY